jgi:hypothetical protein
MMMETGGHHIEHKLAGGRNVFSLEKPKMKSVPVLSDHPLQFMDFASELV